MQLPLYSTSALWRRQFRYDFCTLRTTSQARISVCMQGRRECCPVCVRIPELFVRVPTAVRYASKCCVTSHGTSTGLLGTFQASNIGEWYTKKLFSSSIIFATHNFWWEFPFKVYATLLCTPLYKKFSETRFHLGMGDRCHTAHFIWTDCREGTYSTNQITCNRNPNKREHAHTIALSTLWSAEADCLDQQYIDEYTRTTASIATHSTMLFKSTDIQ